MIIPVQQQCFGTRFNLCGFLIGQPPMQAVADLVLDWQAFIGNLADGGIWSLTPFLKDVFQSENGRGKV